MNERSWKDKVALVTGGGSGIGRASCLAFARVGAAVMVSDIETVHGLETVRLVEQAGGRALFVRADVSVPSEAQSMVAATVAGFGRLDCAFNNAGIAGARGTVADYEDAAWERVIAVNLVGVRLCMKHELKQMLIQGSGAIVNNASILGTVGFAGASAYVAAKHGVLGLTKAAALEYGTSGIRVNAVCPGFIETPMLEDAGFTTDPAVRASIEALHPMNRLGRPEEVADVAVWLCGPEASFITGHPLLIDGGYIAR
jgi:NAD(P)-dependent dehydrogenase (short-subunit alcohol dehydrogenase family)